MIRRASSSFSSILSRVRIKPFIEGFDRVEDSGKNKVEEGPEFGEIVLKRRASQDEAITRVIVSRQGLRKLALGVLHTMSLVCKIVNYATKNITKETHQ
jgi:hypothetical protein